MPGHSSFLRCWRKRQPLAAQAIHLPGIPARLLHRFQRRVLHRASAVHFPVLSHRLPLLRDHRPDLVEAVHRAAGVAVEAEAVGKLPDLPKER